MMARPFLSVTALYVTPFRITSTDLLARAVPFEVRVTVNSSFKSVKVSMSSADMLVADLFDSTSSFESSSNITLLELSSTPTMSMESSSKLTLSVMLSFADTHATANNNVKKTIKLNKIFLFINSQPFSI